jgi:hypothetical protein
MAAQEIHRLGSAPGLAVVHAWRSYPELAVVLPEPERNLTVGVAVRPETFARIRSASGMPELADVPPEEDAQEFAMDFAGGIRLDILTTRDPLGGGAIARYLNKFGEGIQQVEFRCTDVDLASAALKTRFALSPVYPETRPGANGTRINFFLVPIAGGTGKEKLLLELYEIR